MSYPIIPLVLADALEQSGVSFNQLASNFISSLKTALQTESAVISHDTVIQYSEGLSWVIRGLKEDSVYPVGNSIIKDVIIPYLTTMSSETIHQTPPSLKAVAKLLAGLLCHSIVGLGLVEDVLIPLVTALCTHESLHLQAKHEDTSEVLQVRGDHVLQVQGDHLDPWLVLIMLQTVFQQGVTAQLQTYAGGGKTISMLFSQSLQLFKSLPAACCQLLASSVLPLFITQESACQSGKQLWKLVEAVQDGRTTVTCGKAELVQTILCCFSDLIIGRDRGSPFVSIFATALQCALPVWDIRNEETFLTILQEGAMSTDPLERKRCRYLIQRLISSTEEQGKLVSQDWTFWWDKEHDAALRAVWSDVILLLETLEEKTVHIVLPVLNRLKSLVVAVNTAIDGHSLLHLSWLEVVFTRVIDHESKSIIKWGVSEFLNMHTLSSSPRHWKFILGPLLRVLNKSILYERDASEHFRGCPPIVSSLSGFLTRFVGALPSSQRGSFVCQFISACWMLKLVDVPLVYVSYSLSLLPPMPVLDSLSLLAIRSLVQGSLHTVKRALRVAIQGFLLTAVCSLTNMAVVSYSDIFSTLGCFNSSECLMYGSHAWEQVTSYLREFSRSRPGSLCSYLHGAIQDSLQERSSPAAPTTSHTAAPTTSHTAAPTTSHTAAPTTSYTAAPTTSHTAAPTTSHTAAPTTSHTAAPTTSHTAAPTTSHTAAPTTSHTAAPTTSYTAAPTTSHTAAPTTSHTTSHTAAPTTSHTAAPTTSHTAAPTTSYTAMALVLALSCHDVCPEDSVLVPSGQPVEEVLAHLLDPVLHTIVSASNRPYLSPRVVVRAVEVMVGVVEVLVVGGKSGKVDMLLYKYILPWLPSLWTHCEHELLQGSQNGSQPDLDHTLLYKRAINRMYTFASNFSFPVNVNSVISGALELLNNNDGQSAELTATFLGAITVMAWATTLPRGSVDQHFLNFPVAITIKKPIVSTSWDAQPEWSVLFHHCLTCYWQCVLHCLQLGGEGMAPLKDRSSASALAEACINSVDMIHGDLNVFISCLAILAPELDSGILCSYVDQLWAVLMQYKTTPYFSGALASFISLCFNASFDKLNTPSIFTMQAKYIKELTELGQGKSRAYMLLVEHLCSTWVDLLNSDPDLLVPNLQRHALVVIDACSFGPIYRKNLRLFEDTQLFISGLGDMGTTNPLEKRCSEHKSKDCYVRARMLSFLVQLASLVDRADVQMYLMSLLVMMADKLLQLSIDNPKYFTNTCIHRVKLRLAQAMLVHTRCIDKPTSDQVIQLLLKCLRHDNQVSVRYLMEWMTAFIFCRHPDLLEPLFYPCLQQDSDIRSSRMSSIFTVALHVSRNLSSMEHRISFYSHVMAAIFPWSCSHTFAVRLYAQQLLIFMWGEAPGEVASQYPMLGEVVRSMQCSSDHDKALRKLQDNVFFSRLNIMEDLNIQTIFQVLPQITGVIEEEWLHVLKGFKACGAVWERGVAPLSLESSNQVLIDLTKTCVERTSLVDTGEEIQPKSCDDDVQRKISLLSGGGLLGELFPAFSLPRHRAQSGLILVTSLVQKIPNLGGLCRTCEVFGVSEIIVEDLSVLKDREFQSLSVTAEKWMVISEVKVHAIPKYLSERRLEGYTITGLEQTAESCNILHYQFKHKTVLVLGNEHYGIPMEVLHLMDECVEAPQYGVIRSLNVHVAGAIAIWEYTKQHCANA